jgi:ribose transport system substrate-binding protein
MEEKLMKKKLLLILLCIVMAMTFGLAACGSADKPASSDTPATNDTTSGSATEEPTTGAATDTKSSGLDYDLSGKKIGVTFYDLTNPIWAATGENIVKFGQELGATITLVSCEGDASKQVSQVENFIADKMDLIVIGPQDANAMVEVVKKAKDAGILVMAYGQSMESVDSQYVVENYEAGRLVGKAAGEWINEKLDGKAKVGMLDYPLQADIIDRANGIIDAMKEVCPGAEIVQTATSADAVSGMEAVENFLQANSDMKVITCIGDGGAIGANEAVKSGGKADDTFGIFSCDGTEEAIAAMLAGDPIRVTVGLGTPSQKASQVIDLGARMMLGQPYEKNEYTPKDPVDIDNAQEYWDNAGYGA